MSEIAIKPLTENPFQLYPEFQNIWPHRHGLPERDTVRYLEDNKNDRYYLILKDELPIGRTGIWLPEETPTSLGTVCGLAWHGIIPNQRKNGYSKIAIDLICDEARKYYPEALAIEEWVPEDKEFILGPYFKTLGFHRTDRSSKYDEEYPGIHWIIYSKPLYGEKT